MPSSSRESARVEGRNDFSAESWRQGCTHRYKEESDQGENKWMFSYSWPQMRESGPKSCKRCCREHEPGELSRDPVGRSQQICLYLRAMGQQGRGRVLSLRVT